MIDWSKITLKEFAGYVSEALKQHGIDAVLVGGACVTIYSNNRYQSYDLDYVTYEDMSKVRKVLKGLGFKEKSKYFQIPECKWFVEFVSPPIAVGNEAIFEFAKEKTPLGMIKLLRPIDTVKDRLSNFYHWNDKEGLAQAIQICQEQKIDLDELEKWSKQEGSLDKFTHFLHVLSG